MEKIGNLNQLELIRQRANQAVNTAISTSDLFKVVPEFKIVTMEGLNENKLVVKLIYENRLRCKQCTKHGEEVNSDCCRIEPVIYTDKIMYSAGPCEKQLQYQVAKKADRIMEQSRVGKRFQGRRFDTFNVNDTNRKAFEACKEYVNSFSKSGSGLMLAGKFGTGKTHLAVAMIHELAKKDVFGIFVTAPDLLQKIRTSFDGGNEKVAEIMEIVKTAEFLVLDDLGAERANEWVKEQFYMIINARYENMLPTVVTTNLEIEELENQIGKRIVSRLIEMTDGVWFDGPDYRTRKLEGA